MNMKLSRLALTALALAVPSLAQAHPGLHMHGFAAGVAHPLTGLDHLLAMVAVGFWAASLGGAARFVVPGAFVSFMTLGAAAGANLGVDFPLVEYAIAASVIALGLLVAFDARVPTAAAAALVGVFAVFHGYAHGAEAPAGQSLAMFGAGFVLATIALHGAGLALGSVRFGRMARFAGVALATTGVWLVASI